MNQTEQPIRNQVWNVMNDLDTHSSHFINIREMLDAVITSLEQKDTDKAESLCYITTDLINHYIDQYETNFKRAWDLTLKVAESVDTKQNVTIF